MVFPGEQWLPFKHLREDAAGAPDIHLHIILLPREHDLWRPVIPCGDVSSHLRVLYTGQAKVANLQVAILVDKDVAGLEIAVDHPSRMNVFETPLYLSALAFP